MAMQLERRDGRKPDRAAANHQRHFGIIHAEMFHRMNANRHGFGQRGVIGFHRGRQRQQHTFRERHIFGKAARHIRVVAHAQYC